MRWREVLWSGAHCRQLQKSPEKERWSSDCRALKSKSGSGRSKTWNADPDGQKRVRVKCEDGGGPSVKKGQRRGRCEGQAAHSSARTAKAFMRIAQSVTAVVVATRLRQAR